MNEEMKLLIGLFSSAILGLAGWFWASVSALHKRINRVRDEYVRRDDLDGHIQRLAQDIERLRADQKETSDKVSDRLDRLFDMLAEDRKGS